MWLNIDFPIITRRSRTDPELLQELWGRLVGSQSVLIDIWAENHKIWYMTPWPLIGLFYSVFYIEW